MTKLLKKLTDIFRLPTIADQEYAYLSEASNLYDLELREREVDRGRFRAYRSAHLNTV